ncbi:MAG TPA: glycosyltransferase family 2 protein [Solirubrobacteraceae bacterium]|nr:glycosyltransferase family 2 protein [Solirubrobacteraceae bacterium]
MSALTRADRVQFWAIALLWAVANFAFWKWWLHQTPSSTPWLYWAETVALFYQTTLLPTVFWRFVSRMKRPVEIPPASGMRVALITLCVPAHESLDVIRAQLDALQSVSYPHDSWILDEGDSAQVRSLAHARGVRYFTRWGIEAWNQPRPPFQAATKAGNVNAWLDHIDRPGLDYEVFVQLDIDHRPRRDYLDRVLGYFRDATVAWVQAPSVCGNLDNWAARGLAEQDLVFQGPLQMGFYGATGTPFIIGSHTSYRTAAVREIGGFQPTRAEDHLDTVVLAAHGYTGVFVPDPIAVGDGPHDLATYLRQQFAWAYSMIQIFFQHTPRLIRRYTPGQVLQFLFCQSWYTLWSCSLGVLWLLPALAVLANRSIASVDLIQFLLYFLPVMLTSSVMWCVARRWFQPAGVRLSWRGIVLQTARWPVVLWALINVILRIKRPYMITPKGKDAGAGPRPFTVYGPYIFLTAFPLLAIWVAVTAGASVISGYDGLVLVNAVMGAAVLATTLGMDIKQVAARQGASLATLRGRAGIVVALICLVALLTVSVADFGHQALHAMSTAPPQA